MSNFAEGSYGLLRHPLVQQFTGYNDIATGLLLNRVQQLEAENASLKESLLQANDSIGQVERQLLYSAAAVQLLLVHCKQVNDRSDALEVWSKVVSSSYTQQSMAKVELQNQLNDTAAQLEDLHAAYAATMEQLDTAHQQLHVCSSFNIVLQLEVATVRDQLQEASMQEEPTITVVAEPQTPTAAPTKAPMSLGTGPSTVSSPQPAKRQQKKPKNKRRRQHYHPWRI